MIEAALGDDPSGNYVDGAGGNATIAFTNPNDGQSQAIKIDNAIHYDSPYDLTIISGTSIGIIGGELQNSGSGDITLIAGWNSEAITGQDIFDTVRASDPFSAGNSLVSLFLDTAGSYGVAGKDPHNGSIQIGCDINDDNCSGGSAVGSASGTTTVLTNDLFVYGNKGFAQLGFAGDASGDIAVDANGDVILAASTDPSCAGCYAQIGNGGYGTRVTRAATSP